MNNILEIKNLSKKFPSKSGKMIEAVKNVNFTVKEGEIFGFLGANGAGKSTTIKMVTTQLLPSTGEIKFDGHVMNKDIEELRKKIGVVAQHNNLDRLLTAEENLIYHGKYFGMDDKEIKQRSEELLKKFGLWERRKDYVKTYSGGMAQRLKIARAMIHKPRILFLDEPTTGLDPNYRAILWEQMLKMNKEGTTIFLTTHYMEEPEEFCDHIAIMKQGTMLEYGTVEEIIEKTGSKNLNDAFVKLTNNEA